jgi:hypothetical protein
VRRRVVTVLFVISLASACSGADEAPPAEPLAARALPAVAWTGDELFVFGGLDLGPGDFVTDGVLLDPATGGTSRVPSLDLGDPIAFPQAVVVGTEAFVIGTRCSAFLEGDACRPGTTAMASFDTRSETWTEVAFDGPASQVGDTAYEVLGVTSDDRIVLRVGRDRGSFWTYDVHTQAWAELPAPGRINGNACLMGDTVVAVTRPRGVRATVLRLFDLGAADPAWVSTGGAPRAPGPAPTAVTCSDDLVLAFGPEAAPAVFQPREGWRLTSRRPGGYLDNQAVAWTDDEFVFARVEHGARAQAYEPQNDGWRELVPPPRQVLAVTWTGSELIGTPWLTTDQPALAHTPYALDLSRR